ncbi:MAG: nucleotidyltransferase domain-containing protein [Candidatus Aenigmatarchaeota archaeon]
MKRNEVIAYVYDFLHFLLDSSKQQDSIDSIILFGSVARGDFDKQSDVDIFVNTKDDALKKKVDHALNQFEKASEHSWDLRGIELPIKCIVGDLDSKAWSLIKREIISSGIVLYGSYHDVPKKMNHYALIMLDLSKLSPKKKVKVIRELYGYEIKQPKKLYKIQGIVETFGGVKLNPNTIIIPMKKYRVFYDFLSKNRLLFRIREVWME